MRLVHLADLHLGFRQYQRLTPTGINQREADIAGTFRRAIDKTIELRPDLILVAGDVFQSPRPTNQAIVHAFRQFTRLRASLPESLVVMIAGNHDTPRSVETGGILTLFEELGFHVAATAARRFQFPNRGLEVLAVPNVPGEIPALAPNASLRHTVLVMHQVIEGAFPKPSWCADAVVSNVTVNDLNADSWSYVALGHYHVYRHVRANAWFSGSIDYASPNIWGELSDERAQRVPGKGLIEHDLDTGAHRFHHIEPARAVVDLRTVHARGLTAPEVDVAIREAVEECPGGIEDKLVRLLVYDVPRHVTRGLDHRAVREYRKRAFHFHLDLRRPEVIRVQSSGSPGRRASLAELVRDSLRSRHLDKDVDREELVALGLRYLRDAEAAETPVLVEQETE